MAQPEAQERSPRVRKDAKIALIVILALMVLVVVIWGRSPKPGDTLATPAPAATEEAKETSPGTPDAAPAADAGTPAVEPTEAPSLFPGEAAMMNHVSPDRASLTHRPATASGERVALRGEEPPADPPAAASGPAPAAAAAEPRPATRPAVTHTVVKGDTYTKLAAKYYRDGSKWQLIQRANGNQPTLRLGQKIVIPPLPDAPASTETVTPKPSAPDKPATTDKPAPDGPTRPAPTTPERNPGRTYTVKKGDTFMAIARVVYRDPGKWKSLYQHNRSKLPNPAKPDSLRPGTVIDLPALASNQ